MTESELITVAIADDHSKVREGVRRLLEQIPGLEIIGEAEDGRQAVMIVEELSPDMLILDIQMPVMDGLSVIEVLTQKGFAVDILVFSAIDDEIFREEALSMGACYYIEKANFPALVEAIQEILHGKRCQDDLA